MLNNVTETVKETLTQKATETQQLISTVTTHINTNYAEPAAQRVAQGLTQVVQMVESYDTGATQRTVVYGAGPDQQGKVPESEESKSPNV